MKFDIHGPAHHSDDLAKAMHGVEASTSLQFRFAAISGVVALVCVALMFAQMSSYPKNTNLSFQEGLPILLPMLSIFVFFFTGLTLVCRAETLRCQLNRFDPIEPVQCDDVLGWCALNAEVAAYQRQVALQGRFLVVGEWAAMQEVCLAKEHNAKVASGMLACQRLKMPYAQPLAA